MVIVLQNNFNQANGVAVTAANSAASGDAFSSVAVTNTVLTYSTEQKMHGTASMKVVASGVGTGTGNYQMTAAAWSYRVYISLTGLPSAPMNVVFGYSQTANSTASIFNIDQTGRFGFNVPTAAGGTGVYWIPNTSFTPSLNHWYRVEGSVTLGTAGSVLFRVFDGDSGTPIASLNPTGIYTAAAGAQLTQVQLGKGTSAPTIAPYYLDEFVMQNVATLPGPYSAAPPTVTANANLSGSALSLSATVSTYDSTVSSYLWTQTAGTTVTLSSASAAAPTASLLQAGSYSFRVTITDDLGRAVSDDVAFSYAGSSVAPGVSGLGYANEFVEVLTATPTTGGAISWAVSDPNVQVVAAGLQAVLHGPTPRTSTAYTVTATEAGNSNVTSYRFTVAGTPTVAGGMRILVASADQAVGGTFL